MDASRSARALGHGAAVARLEGPMAMHAVCASGGPVVRLSVFLVQG